MKRSLGDVYPCMKTCPKHYPLTQTQDPPLEHLLPNTRGHSFITLAVPPHVPPLPGRKGDPALQRLQTPGPPRVGCSFLLRLEGLPSIGGSSTKTVTTILSFTEKAGIRG